eukprot:3883173-Amphidinium_carterae.1
MPDVEEQGRIVCSHGSAQIPACRKEESGMVQQANTGEPDKELGKPQVVLVPHQPISQAPQHHWFRQDSRGESLRERCSDHSRDYTDKGTKAQKGPSLLGCIKCHRESRHVSAIVV